jgi:signal transduction histidine kinase/CheY-like chemotaxis protein
MSAAIQSAFARVLRTEETRFREAALMESVLYQVDVGILVAEVNGTLSYATPPAARLLGLPARALVGNRGTTGLSSLLAEIHAEHENGRPFQASELPVTRALKEKAGVREVTMRIQRPGRGSAVLEMSATPLFEEDGSQELVGAIQVMVDRTESSERARELARAYDELRQLQARLLERSRTLALGQLASGAAHALNNYLNALRLRIALLRREYNPEHLNALDRTVGKVGELVSRLQEFSVHRWEEELVHAPVRSVVREALELAQAELSEPGREVRIERNLEGLGGQSRVDVSALRELLVNLLLAARDRMPGGGVLRVNGSQRDDEWRVDLEDQGPRFSEEELSRLFDPLEPRSRAPQLSLVLAVARNQVRRWGGDLIVRNRQDQKGATFRVTLPSAPGEPEQPVPEEPKARAFGPRERPRCVLVVDDDPDNASILAELLGDEGYEVEVARDGAEARQRMDHTHFDAAFLDALLPDCSGWDLARELRERSPQALVAMVTGADVRGQNRQSLALVDAVFRKPVDVGALDDFLRQPHEERREGSDNEEGAELPH